MSIYEDYAAVYDRAGQYAFSLRMIGYLQRLLHRHSVPEERLMLDLACGTGTVAIDMAQKGWRVYGVDGSQRMLREAQAKADVAQVEVTWSAQDMREFTLPERVSLATCLYDSMNYMTNSDDLCATFRSVYATLKPGGLFLFDMNTAHAFDTVWSDATYFSDSDDLSVVMHSVYDERAQRANVTVTCFERVGDLYRKIVEHHSEQAFPPEQIATHLTDVGLQVEAQYECFTFDAPDEEASRIMFVGRRPR